MKLYLIYRKYKNLTPTLYALTDNKELLKEFLKLRNEELFEVITKSDLSKKEINQIKDREKSKLLHVGNFDYASSNQATFVMTDAEEMDIFTHSEQYMYEIFGKNGRDLKLVETCNPEILKALKDLDYFTLLTGSLHHIYNPYDINPFPLPKFQPDMLGLFIKKYGHLFKK